MSSGARRLAVCALLALLGPLAAAEERLSWSAERKPLSSALAELAQLSDTVPSLAFDTATGPAATVPVTLVLREAPSATLRQAVAHAAGRWWAIDPASGRTLLTGDAHLPRGALRVRAQPNGMRAAADAEATVRALIGPWLGRAAGVDGEATLVYDATGGTWTAVLDAAGQAQLVDLLSLLQLPRPQVPDLVPDAETPDPDAALDVSLQPGSWGVWTTGLAAALGGSVALAPGLDGGATAPALALSGTRRDLPAALVAAGLRAAAIHGAWCIARTEPADALHPALRRRIAVLPIPHLARTDDAGPRIAGIVRGALGDAVWNLPGWDLRWSAPSHGLLVAADAPTIHRVLDVLDVLDRNGPTSELPDLSAIPTRKAP